MAMSTFNDLGATADILVEVFSMICACARRYDSRQTDRNFLELRDDRDYMSRELQHVQLKVQLY